jgi:hypothetical protein
MAVAATGTAAVVAPVVCGTDPDCLANQVKAANFYPRGQGVDTNGVDHTTYVLSGSTTGASTTPSTTFLANQHLHGD